MFFLKKISTNKLAKLKFSGGNCIHRRATLFFKRLVKVCEPAALMCISGFTAKRISAIATAIYQERQLTVAEF